MLQKYINFGTCKKKMHFFEKNSAIKHYFCGEFTTNYTNDTN